MLYMHIFAIITTICLFPLHAADSAAFDINDASNFTREACLGLYQKYAICTLDIHGNRPIEINLAINKDEPENIINLDTEEDPFTLETFRSLIAQTKEDDSSFILASYRCQSQDPSLNKIKHADGQSLIEWQEEGGDNCPFSRLPIAQADYHELYFAENKLYVHPLGNKKTFKHPCNILYLMAMHNMVQRGKRTSLIQDGNPNDVFSIPIATIYTEAGVFHQAARWYKKSSIGNSIEPLVQAGLNMLQENADDETLLSNIKSITQCVQDNADQLDHQTAGKLALVYSVLCIFGKHTKTKAVQWALIAAQKGNPRAMELAGDNEIRIGNIQEGLKWYQKGADLGNIKSMIQLFAILPSYPDHGIHEDDLIKYACALDNQYEKEYIDKLKQIEPDKYNHVPEMISLYTSKKRYNIEAIPFIPLIIASFINAWRS